MLTANLSTFSELISPDQVRAYTTLKVKAAQRVKPRGYVSIIIHQAWIKSSSATTVGRLKKVDVDPEPYFLAVQAGIDLFQDILKGLMENGIVVGYQEKPDTFDKVFEVKAPLPLDVQAKVIRCFDSMIDTMVGEIRGVPK